MNPKQQEAMAKRLVEILIATGIFTDKHRWVRLPRRNLMDVIEKEKLIQAIREAIAIYEGECLAKAWAKHKKESGT